MKRWTKTSGVLLAWALVAGVAGAAEQQVLRSRYRLSGAEGPLGWTELTELRRDDGSRSWLARERMEFWGPVLDRFVVLTFDPDGHFDSGHWVGTSEYSADFTYTFRFDGRAIRGDWRGSVRGEGWSEVPARAGEPLLGFWGPLESLLLARFDTEGPDRQDFDAIDVEDSHHRRLHVAVERVGVEEVDVPAGRFRATRYRSERFGPTEHWIAEDGTILRWSSEGGAYRWELEVPPSPAPLPRGGSDVARGEYAVSGPGGKALGSVAWTIRRDAEGLWLDSRERLDSREGRLEGRLDGSGRWRGASETVHWAQAEGSGDPEIHQLDTFFFRESVHVMRFRDRAYPLLQSRRVASGDVAYHHVDHPITAAFWLRRVLRRAGDEQALPELAHIANRYRGGGLEVQPARAAYRGTETVEGPGGAAFTAHRFEVRYPGGWVDSTFDYWTDSHLVPLRLEVAAGEGPVSYRLVRYELLDPGPLSVD